MVYIENPKDSIKNLFELTNSIKLQDSRSTYEKISVVICKLPEVEIKKAILFIIGTKISTKQNPRENFNLRGENYEMK
jgi:hypothetical protein